MAQTEITHDDNTEAAHYYRHTVLTSPRHKEASKTTLRTKFNCDTYDKSARRSGLKRQPPFLSQNQQQRKKSFEALPDGKAAWTIRHRWGFTSSARAAWALKYRYLGLSAHGHTSPRCQRRLKTSTRSPGRLGRPTG